MIRQTLTALTAAAAVFAFSDKASAVAVDTELQLLVDVSGSVNATEFDLQRSGYSAAFRDSDIQDLILDTDGGNRKGKLAVQFIYWATGQAIGVDWTLIDTIAAADAFADAVDAAARPFGGNTGPGSAINFGLPLFANNGFEGDALVMDVSGDGTRNTGADTSDARDNALANGVTRINGLPIGGGAGLFNFYNDNIAGGPGSFVLQTSSFTDFSDAVKRKLAFEITGDTPTIPVPASIPLLLSGLGMIGALRLRRKSA